MNDSRLSLLTSVQAICERAGREVLNVYYHALSYGTREKGDGSPLTVADLRSNQVITDGLLKLTPDIPIVSEEDAEIPVHVSAKWSRYWLVDPLDGTKEFVARNGEFTVNIALVEATGGVGNPVLGVVYAPAIKQNYLGLLGEGAWRIDGNGQRRKISPQRPEGVVSVVASRSHNNSATEAFIEDLGDRYGIVHTSSSGSSLKLCKVAEGAAHYYPRVAPTMAWDTAAAQAVVEAAGGVVWRFGTRNRLTYDAQSLRNPPFLVAFGQEAFLPRTYSELEIL